MAASNTIIIGAGIIGVSTAYYLAKHQQPSTIHLVEASPELFASASGYAGGFIARDWFGPGVSSLGALSYDEHRRLAEVYDGASRWGYRRTTAWNYNPGPRREKTSARGEDFLRTGASRARVDHKTQDGELTTEAEPSWLRRTAGDSISVIGDEGSTAQVDPLRLCQFLLDECLQQGVHLHHPAKVIAVLKDTRNELSSVTIADTTSSTETDVPCTKLIIAAGAWSAQVFAELFPTSSSTLPISGLAGHSLVIKSPRWTEEMSGCHAVFARSRAGYSPEIFSRPGGEIWIGGLNSSTIPLPQTATEREIQAEAIAKLKEEADLLFGSGEEAVGDDLKIVREGLCFRPVTPYGTPIISRVDDEHLGGDIATRPDADGGVYLAAGHGPWGISLSLGTGKVLAEMVQGRRPSADVSSVVMW
ncbi:hypothetical protein N0V82_009663 [Gnomoniopsis sp. IMI 355080]|nr:hypothetical protein N0V82_009663 [Gnomoniopsis sp. IMI 355080]